MDKNFSSGKKKPGSANANTLRNSMERGSKIIAFSDNASFGAPRESFYNVVGPNKFNYLPKKPQDAAPGQYETSHPYK